MPLEKKRRSDLHFMKSSKKRHRMKFGGDNRILLRIKELMETTKNLSYIDEDQLLSDLQYNYPEYRRKKRGDLKAAIKKATQLFVVDGESSKEDCCSLSSENNVESPTKRRYIEFEDAKYSKKRKLDDDDDDGSIHSLETCAVRKKSKILKNSTQGSKIKDSKVQKSQSPGDLKKQVSKGPIPQFPTVTFSDVGGQTRTLLQLNKLLMPLKFPKLSSIRFKRKPCGILFHGPPGCGKTFLVHAAAGEMQLPLIEVGAADLISGVSGESEEKIRNVFEEAAKCSPCILFIDEVDAFTPKREFSSKGMEKRVVSQLLKSMDDLRTRYVDSRVLVIGATNIPEAIDPAFRRGGRFGKEIHIGIPDEDSRISILKVICKDLSLSSDFDFRWVASRTPGYVGADLQELVQEAADEAYDRILKKLCAALKSDPKIQQRVLQLLNEAGLQVNSITEVPKEFLSTDTFELIKMRALSSVSENEANPIIEMLTEEFHVDVDDFQASLDNYVPCSTREGFTPPPSVPWERVGGLKEIKEELKRAILWPHYYREDYDKLCLPPPTAVLLWGPKGCGKTLLAKAAASECSVNFIYVKGPELFNMYVGESERNIRQVFQRARNSAPCVILFDEIDSLIPVRSGSAENTHADKFVGQFLSEMNPVECKAKVFVIGTTNRIENVDTAILRQGRFGSVHFVGLPTPEERVEILKAVTENGTKPKLGDDVDLETLGLDCRCDGFSGADLEALVVTASWKALQDRIEGNINSTGVVPLACFDYAFTKVEPSVSEAENRYFEHARICRTRRVM